MATEETYSFYGKEGKLEDVIGKRFTQVWPPWGNTKDREKLTGVITEVDNSNNNMVKVTCLYDVVSEGAGNFATQYSGMKYPNIALSQLLVEGMDQEIPWDNSLGARIRRKMGKMHSYSSMLASLEKQRTSAYDYLQTRREVLPDESIAHMFAKAGRTERYKRKGEINRVKELDEQIHHIQGIHMTSMVQRAYIRAIERAPPLVTAVDATDQAADPKVASPLSAKVPITKREILTAARATDDGGARSSVINLHIDPTLDPQVQLIRFFTVFPGLKRQIGGWIVRYYLGSVPTPPDP